MNSIEDELCEINRLQMQHTDSFYVVMGQSVVADLMAAYGDSVDVWRGYIAGYLDVIEKLIECNVDKDVVNAMLSGCAFLYCNTPVYGHRISNGAD